MLIVVISCSWSRAINMKLCLNLSTDEFLRNFQMHCFEFGVPASCITDLGTQLTASANLITDYLKDSDSKKFFEEQGINKISFDQYFKGCSKLGSMVEICVKLTKRLIYGSIKNNIVSIRDFEFLLSQVAHIVNRRPIAFKDSLRDSEDPSVPDPITPELLIRGYDLVSINVVPHLHDFDYNDPDFDHPSLKVKDSYSKLRRVRSNLKQIYHSEFIGELIGHSVSEKDKYKPVKHKLIDKGTIVLLKEDFTKPQNYPMGIVKNIVKNDMCEVTAAVIRKGSNREIVKRHSSTLIPLLETNNVDFNSENESEDRSDKNISSSKPKRKAAIKSAELTKQILVDNFN